MYVSKQERILYLANPKSASQATSGALCRMIADMRRFGPHHNYPNPAAMHTLQIDLEAEDWLVVTGVRNHFNTLVSWHHHYQHGVPFGVEFIDKLHKGLLGPYFPRHDQLWNYMVRHANRIVDVERLDLDLNSVLAERGLGPISVPIAHATAQRKGRPYQEFYDDELRAVVEERYKEEMALYDYTWEDL